MEANGRISKTDWSQYFWLNQIEAKNILEHQADKFGSLNGYQEETHVSIGNSNQYCRYKVIHGLELDIGILPQLAERMIYLYW
jgi:hypothetical protein